MKAITISQHGGPEVMKFSDIPLPEVGPDQVLVQISAVGVNFIDIYQRSGLYPLELPAIPGLEGAGQVIKSRRQVKNFKPGDNVAFCDTLGAYAEYAVVLADRLFAIPDSLLPSHAAAIMVQGITGCYLSTETYSLKPGDRCLIHAAAGGVGQLLVQVAVRIGAYIIGTTSTAKKEKKAALAGWEKDWYAFIKWLNGAEL